MNSPSYPGSESKLDTAGRRNCLANVRTTWHPHLVTHSRSKLSQLWGCAHEETQGVDISFKQFRKWRAEHLCDGQCNVHPICPARRRMRWRQHTPGTIHLSAPTSSARNTSFGPFARFLDPRTTRNKESDSLVEPTLAFTVMRTVEQSSIRRLNART
jgi:hypothetical protein